MDLQLTITVLIQWEYRILLILCSVLNPLKEYCTTNFSTVIEQVNKKFNTTYQLFIHIDKIYREIERINEALDLGKETHVARPSKERDNVKNSILFTKEDEKLLEDAVSLYCRLIQK